MHAPETLSFIQAQIDDFRAAARRADEDAAGSQRGIERLAHARDFMRAKADALRAMADALAAIAAPPPAQLELEGLDAGAPPA